MRPGILLFRQVLVLFVVLLSGCGFHPSYECGANSQDQLEGVISVTSYDQYGIMTRLLRRELNLSDFDVVPPGEDVLNLYVVSELLSSRTLSVYRSAHTAEKELSLRINYQVTTPNNINRDLTAIVSRSYLNSPFASMEEITQRLVLLSEMREQIAHHIVQQVVKESCSVNTGNFANMDRRETPH